MAQSSKSSSKLTSKVVLNIVFLGDPGSGKSSIVHRLTDKPFSIEHDITNTSVYSLEVSTDKNVAPQLCLLWDIGGNQALSDQVEYPKPVDCVVLIFDVTNRASFENLPNVKQRFFRNFHQIIGEQAKFPFVILANKTDLPDRQVTNEEAVAWCEAEQHQYFEVSAKNAENINSAFQVVVRTALHRHNSQKSLEVQTIDGKKITQNDMVSMLKQRPQRVLEKQAHKQLSIQGQSPKDLLYLTDLDDCVVQITGPPIAKLVIQHCVGCSFVLNCSVITGVMEIINVNTSSLVIGKQVELPTISIDATHDFVLVYRYFPSKPEFSVITLKNTSGIRLVEDFDGISQYTANLLNASNSTSPLPPSPIAAAAAAAGVRPVLDYPIPEGDIISRRSGEGGSWVSEKMVREGSGWPTTEREKLLADERRDKNLAILAQRLQENYEAFLHGSPPAGGASSSSSSSTSALTSALANASSSSTTTTSAGSTSSDSSTSLPSSTSTTPVPHSQPLAIPGKIGKETRSPIGSPDSVLITPSTASGEKHLLHQKHVREAGGVSFAPSDPHVAEAAAAEAAALASKEGGGTRVRSGSGGSAANLHSVSHRSPSSASTASTTSLTSKSYTMLDQVIFEKQFFVGDSVVTLREFANIDCTKAPLLEGFPGFGLTSIIVGSYIRQQLELPLIGVIVSDELPPCCVVNKGHAAYPVRLFGDRRLILAVSDIKIPEKIQPAVVRAVLDFAQRHRASEIYSMDGILSEEPSNIVRFVTTNADNGERLMNMADCENIGDGIIPGVTGLLLAESTMGQIDVTCLLAHSNSRFPDAKGAVRIVEILNELLSAYDVSIETESLHQTADSLEERMEKALKGASATSGPGDLRSSYDMYT